MYAFQLCIVYVEIFTYPYPAVIISNYFISTKYNFIGIDLYIHFLDIYQPKSSLICLKNSDVQSCTSCSFSA